MPESEKAAFIGLGSMGAPIARRLARSGYSIVGCDVLPAALQVFDEPGHSRTRSLESRTTGEAAWHLRPDGRVVGTASRRQRTIHCGGRRRTCDIAFDRSP